MLERTRERLARHFPQTAELTVVLHPSATSLGLSNPLMPAIWRSAAPSSRPYVTGWVGARELHVLSPAALRARASGTTGSFEMLALTPASLYARRVILECNPDIRRARSAHRGLIALRWAWLLEGASRWLSGESRYARAVVGRHVRQGRRPRFPPSPRDAPLLGATLVELLAGQRGEAAVARLSGRLHPQGGRGALARAFEGRSLAAVEDDWRASLRRLAEAH